MLYITQLFIILMIFTAGITIYSTLKQSTKEIPFKKPFTQYGYMFALNFSDQGTGSFVNLMSMLCLASKLRGIRVVEPFMVRSVLGLNVSANWTKEVKFSDVFDKGTALKQARREHYNLLVPFDEFLRDAPRKLLVVQHKCTLCVIQCGHPDALVLGQTFSKMNGFDVVGQVCLDYKTSGKTTLKEIENQLFSTYERSEIVIMFLHFGGVRGVSFHPTDVYRLHISMQPQCYREQCTHLSYIRPSQLVSESVKKYMDTYLRGKRYVSVMIRLEMILRMDHNKPGFTKICLNSMQEQIHKITSKVGINNIFLCVDVGKYGSDWGIGEEPTLKAILPLYNSFLSQILGEGMTLSKLDSTFTNTTLIDNPGFVAMMQKSIAAMGDVLVLLGHRSNFHKSALELYKSLHKHEKVFKLHSSCHL